MEDPKTEIYGVVSRLVQNSSLKVQRETLAAYFTRDVRFFHFLVNTAGGLQDLMALYQFWAIFNYPGSLHVTIHGVWYNEEEDSMTVHLTQHTRPVSHLGLPLDLELLVMLQLEDEMEVGGRVVGGTGDARQEQALEDPRSAPSVTHPTGRKRIAMQKDFFIRSPALAMIPVFGFLYTSNYLRFLAGHVQVVVFWMARDFILRLFAPFKAAAHMM